MDGIQREMIRNRALGNRYQRQETRSEEQQWWEEGSMLILIRAVSQHQWGEDNMLIRAVSTRITEQRRQGMRRTMITHNKSKWNEQSKQVRQKAQKNGQKEHKGSNKGDESSKCLRRCYNFAVADAAAATTSRMAWNYAQTFWEIRPYQLCTASAGVWIYEYMNSNFCLRLQKRER